MPRLSKKKSQPRKVISKKRPRRKTNKKTMKGGVLTGSLTKRQQFKMPLSGLVAGPIPRTSQQQLRSRRATIRPMSERKRKEVAFNALKEKLIKKIVENNKPNDDVQKFIDVINNLPFSEKSKIDLGYLNQDLQPFYNIKAGIGGNQLKSSVQNFMKKHSLRSMSKSTYRRTQRTHR